MTARARRESDGTTVIDPLHVPRRAADRMRGLLGRDALDDGEGMWLRRCRMIHTIGMRFPIDLVYLTDRGEVCKVVESLPPWRISACLGADSVIELQGGAARRLGLGPGTRLSILP
ncbi:MAG: DUF192 domain-containing protein [Planctomycetota bacterium]